MVDLMSPDPSSAKATAAMSSRVVRIERGVLRMARQAPMF
jgi:hypothetical protein